MEGYYTMKAFFGLILLILLFTNCINSDTYIDGKNTLLINSTNLTLPEIDGVIDFSTDDLILYETVQFTNIDDSSKTKRTDIRWIVKRYKDIIYFGIEWGDSTLNNNYENNSLTNNDVIVIQFDNNGDGYYGNDDDRKSCVKVLTGSIFVDGYNTDSGTETDLIGDGLGYMKYYDNSSVYQAEFLIPISDDAKNQDGYISDKTAYNFIFIDSMVINEQTGSAKITNIATLNESMEMSTNWLVVPKEMTNMVYSSEVPTDLSGIIVFIGYQDHPYGEIYTFDPKNYQVERVTYNELYEDTISISNDRTKVCFMAGPSPLAISNPDINLFEIYSINIDGTNLMQLTSNNFLDGHPAWSPDDSKIIFASYGTDDGTGHLFLMDSDGTNLIDLTIITPGYFSGLNIDENDPEWLQDGRVVFKTNRFNNSDNKASTPELSLAIMDIDYFFGVELSNLYQISFKKDVVDHDPIGDPNSESVAFERLNWPADYSTEPWTLFVPWDIVIINLADMTEQTVVHDSFVNWLPVYDPSGEYIAYIKNSGGEYSELQIISKDGKSFGRLIPDVTKIRYFDWK